MSSFQTKQVEQPLLSDQEYKSKTEKFPNDLNIVQNENLLKDTADKTDKTNCNSRSTKILSNIANFGEKFGPLIANIAAMTRHISALLAGVSIVCPPLAIGAAIVGAISAITSLITVVTKISAKILKHREEKKNNQPNKQVDTAPKPLSRKILSALASIGKDSGSVVSKVSDTIRTLYAVFSAFSFLCPPVAIAVAATGAAGALASFVGTISGMILEKKTRQEEDEFIIYPENLTNLDPNTQNDQLEQDVEQNIQTDSSFSSASDESINDQLSNAENNLTEV